MILRGRLTLPRVGNVGILCWLGRVGIWGAAGLELPVADPLVGVGV